MTARHASAGRHRPPRLLLLFGAILLGTATALAWLGWRLVQQDRLLEGQYIEQHLEATGERLGMLLTRQLVEIETALATPGTESSSIAGGLRVTFASDGSIEARPRDMLRFDPSAVPAMDGWTPQFEEGERLEHRQHAYERAADAFRRLTTSTEPALRAGALVRLSRVLRRSGRSEDALAVYSELARVTGVGVAGVPADFLARHSRCALLEEMGRESDLRQEARALLAELDAGRWVLTRGAFRLYEPDVRRWAALAPAVVSDLGERGAMTETVAWLWDEWPRMREGTISSSGRRSLRAEDTPVLVLWHSTPDRLAAFVAGPTQLQTWIAPVEALAAQSGVRFRLADDRGQVVLGPSGDGPARPVAMNPLAAPLPWTIHVWSGDSKRRAPFALRRRLLLAGLGAIGIFVGTGGYVIARALRREMETARLKSDFVATVSHELRTPLATLRQSSEMLADGRVRDEAVRAEYYQGMRRESERLSRLVENLLDFRRMQAGAREYRFAEVDAGGLIREVAADCADRFGAQGYHFDVVVAPDVPPVRADVDALRLAIWNLLDNAVKYSPDCRDIAVDVAREGDAVAIRVRDRGVGLTVEDSRRIFTTFVRGANAVAAGIRGTGLGLAMVREIAAAHGGNVRVDSTPNEGSTFTLILPGPATR